MRQELKSSFAFREAGSELCERERGILGIQERRGKVADHGFSALGGPATAMHSTTGLSCVAVCAGGLQWHALLTRLTNGFACCGTYCVNQSQMLVGSEQWLGVTLIVSGCLLCPRVHSTGGA